MGGDKEYVSKLDELFLQDLDPKYYEDNEDITADCLIGGYVHGSQLPTNLRFLGFLDALIMNRMYRNDIRGLGGNDDCGQMSAWYIFTAMGFYPVCPGTDQYVLGAPYLPYMKIDLPNGNILEIKADGVSDSKRFVREVRLNGKKYTKMYITHSDILNGGTLEFIMSSSPNKKRGLDLSDKPYSLSTPE